MAVKNPDKTFYLAFDLNAVPNPIYHHEKLHPLYPMDAMEMVEEARAPQFNHISLEVSKADI